MRTLYSLNFGLFFRNFNKVQCTHSLDCDESFLTSSMRPPSWRRTVSDNEGKELDARMPELASTIVLTDLDFWTYNQSCVRLILSAVKLVAYQIMSWILIEGLCQLRDILVLSNRQLSFVTDNIDVPFWLTKGCWVGC